jgi:flagellar assembly factor FliW
MPKLSTVYFSELEYSNNDIVNFPAGLPGFEDQIAFLFVEQQHARPLVFMQSLLNPKLCFLVLPVLAVDPDYALSLSADDLAALGLSPGATPRIGAEIGCFTLLTLTEGADPTVNLLAPIVINLQSHKGLQVIPSASEYPIQHPLVLEKETAPCS